MIKEYNSKPQNIICCIAPCIHKESFLVNEDVVKIYKNELGKIAEKSIKKTNIENKNGILYNIDNIEIYKKLFMELGLLEKNIIDSGLCTVKNNDMFYSYRVEKNEKRNGTIMMLKNKH